MSEFITNAELCIEAERLVDENDALREIIADLWPRASFTMSDENKASWMERLAECGVEVDA